MKILKRTIILVLLAPALVIGVTSTAYAPTCNKLSSMEAGGPCGGRCIPVGANCCRGEGSFCWGGAPNCAFKADGTIGCCVSQPTNEGYCLGIDGEDQAIDANPTGRR